MQTPDIQQATTVTSGLLSAAAIGVYAHKHHNKNLIVASYAVAGFAIGYAASDIILRKTKLKDDNGWDGLATVVYAMFGVGLLGATAIVAYFVGKK